MKYTCSYIVASLTSGSNTFNPAALDVHVSPLQSNLVAKAVYTPGQALQNGVDWKLRANLDSCRSAGMDCIPLVAEALGGLASNFIGTIRDIGHSISLKSGSPKAMKHLFDRPSGGEMLVLDLPLPYFPSRT